ncbi:hypothetical protein HU200_047632 [Digitaria exilis]|uniref:Uncharacterized protein n=1 Tax=Digitaria exilis TaxID=1010633 RepID=A0A835ATY4_9POAL|nr:hypothetical protein HU200_047632 [Digitaria exilis]
MNETNHHGYDFSGLEVNITSESGSSGAPLVNLSGDLLGSCMVDVLTVSRTLFL